MKSKKQHITGVKRIVAKESNGVEAKTGSLHSPYHILMGSKEDGMYLDVFVPDDGYYAQTPSFRKGKESWIWHTLSDKNRIFTKDDAVGIKGRGVRAVLKKKLCGSALNWIEAFHSYPENKLPSGFYVSGQCDPKITNVTWKKYQDDNNGAELGYAEAKFGDMLQLHIETEGLNGELLHIDFEEDEEGTIIDSVSDITYLGKLILNVPIKSIWRNKLFNLAEQTFNDYLRLTPIISYTDPKTGKKESLRSNYIDIQNKIADRKSEKGSAVPVSIGRVEHSILRYNPCKFTSLIIKKKKTNRDYIYFDQNKTVINPEPYEMVSGSNKNINNITIKAEGLEVGKCLSSITEHLDEKIVVSYKNNDNIITKEDVVLQGGNTIKHDVICNLSENHLAPLHYIWPKGKRLYRKYDFYFDTCSYKKHVPVHVYSDIKWTLEFQWNHDAPFAYGFSKGLPKHSVDRKKAIGAAIDAEWAKEEGEMAQSFGWSLKAQWDKGDAVEIGDKFMENIRKTLKMFLKVKGIVDGITTQLRGNLPFEFEVKSPAIAISAQWYLKEMDSETPDFAHKVATMVTVGASANPLIGATFTIDLISTLANVGSPAVEKIVRFIRDNAKEYVEILFEIRFNGEIKIDGKLEINTLTPEETTGKIQINGEISVEVELSAKGSTGKFVSGSFEAELEAGITGKASVTGGLEAGADKEGVYVMPVAEFGGVIATFVLKGSVKFGIAKKSFDQSPPEAKIVESDKVEFQKNYLNK
ncbi:hypothetical protein [Zobellia galactanivorans]|uniref:Uncharacterized protein n=1 Tax=Zobellia galactanivorans (strain DSM 12802 / CCUG 47099 / CIP 106680 / NCIMB 13871 / Dsij) TaxID=63186 RepID=G0L9C6_ZOBGA|nr:hypothetical protein [Zobellia galactanivorans]CAZ94484.1 Hypothetical protein ZOBELLIA_411 [Zobellia galactanivorans]